MPRYAALLRGVNPTNCRMADLKQALLSEGFKNVVTVLSSGNVVFDAPQTSNEALEERVERATEKYLGRKFATIIRPVEHLKALLGDDPFAPFAPRQNEKRVVSFLKRPLPQPIDLPQTASKARIVALHGTESLVLYEPEDSPVFMTLIQKTFGQEVTTRTWETVRKVAGK